MEMFQRDLGLRDLRLREEGSAALKRRAMWTCFLCYSPFFLLAGNGRILYE